MTKIFSLLFLLASLQATAQVGIGTTTPNTSAALEIKDTARGILIPRLTQAQRNAISNPAEGLMIYQTDQQKGYWYFDGAQWTKNTSSSTSTGKHTIVLADTITNAQAQAKIAAEFGSNTQEIKIFGCSSLTSVDLSMLTTATNIYITENPVLQNINLSNLVSCEGNFQIQTCPALTSLNLSMLKIVVGEDSKSGFEIYETALTSINVPNLFRVSGSLFIEWNNMLTTLSFPVLKTAGTISITNSSSLMSVTFPALRELTDNSLYSPSFISQCPALTSISFNNLVTFKNSALYADHNKLPSSNINYLLNKFISINPLLTGKTFYLYNQTPLAPPTGQGITDKATLTANGNDVYTD